MLRWSLVPFAAAILLASIGFSSPAAAEEVQVRVDVDISTYPLVRATVTVIDSSGRPIADLPATAFSAGAAGNSVPVVNVATGLDPNVPAAVVLTFDSSGSMSGAAIEQARDAAKTLVSELGPSDQVSVERFSDSVQVVQAFTNDRAALTASIEGITAGGNTALYDGVVASVEALQGGDPRPAIVLLSDGLDHGGVSKNDRDSSLAAARAAGIPFFVIGLGDSIDQPYLQELADVSRGQLFLAPAPSALRGLYGTIGAALRSRYVLDLDAASLDAATPTALEISVNDGVRSGAGQAPLDLTAFVAATPLPTAVLTPPVATQPVATPISTPVIGVPQNNGTPLLLPLGLATMLAVGGSTAAAFWLRWRGKRATEEQVVLPELNGRRPSTPIFTKNEPVFVGTGPAGGLEQPEAWLEVTTAGETARFALGEDPVTVGFTSDCTIRLPNGRTPEAARVRLWRREGRYMLHNLSRLARVSIAGKPALWAVLEDGDEILLGSYRVVFRDSTAPAEEPAEQP